MSATEKISAEQIKAYAEKVRKNSYCVIPNVIPTSLIDEWNEDFQALLVEHINHEGQKRNRGVNRYYVTLPFSGVFANPMVYENDTILSIVQELIGEDGVMCQLATDTPLLGSAYQEIHRDTPPLFPEAGSETPPFQLAVNFSLIDITPEHGPIEIAPGTHMLSKEEGLRKLESGEIKLESVCTKRGDVLIRDVRHLHRGTPNRTNQPRPVVVLGYSRRWLFRPEVNIRIPKEIYLTLSERARIWLRFNPIVDILNDTTEEVYQSFAY